MVDSDQTDEEEALQAVIPGRRQWMHLEAQPPTGPCEERDPDQCLYLAEFPACDPAGEFSQVQACQPQEVPRELRTGERERQEPAIVEVEFDHQVTWLHPGPIGQHRHRAPVADDPVAEEPAWPYGTRPPDEFRQSLPAQPDSEYPDRPAAACPAEPDQPPGKRFQ